MHSLHVFFSSLRGRKTMGYCRVRLLITTLMLTTASLSSLYSQDRSAIHYEFDKLAHEYHNRSLSDEQYFQRIDSLTSHLLSEGIFLDVQQMTDLLQLYEQLAWSNKKYSQYRVDYYLTLLNNAYMADLRGASMYYAEKVSEESRRNGEDRSLIELAQKLYIFSIQKNYPKIITVYEANKLQVADLLIALQKDTSSSYNRGLDAQQLLSPVVTAYAAQRDTVGVEAAAGLIREIGDEIKRRDPTVNHKLMNDFALLEVDFALASFYKNFEEAIAVLHAIEGLKATYADQPTGHIDYNLAEWRTSLYLHIGNVDSAAYYLRQYEAMANFHESQQATIQTYQARLEALKGNYRVAYETIGRAQEETAKTQTKLIEEMDNLLYAYTEAEDSQIALRRAEKIKRQQTLLVFVISCTAIVVILTIYLLMRRKHQKAKRRIATLNDIANIQVAAMEEIKHQAIREEQRRLGRDLHDGLSSMLAGVKHQLEAVLMNTLQPETNATLVKIRNQIENAYAVARNKSHEWYSASDTFQETTFQKRVQTLLDSALPDNRYTKDIQIDEDALSNMPMEARIDLLRIIQEAITNIIKHARANKVEILIYEEQLNWVLSIVDNGQGFGARHRDRRGLGLRSIEHRVSGLGGNMEIRSTPSGSELIINLPQHNSLHS